MKIWRQDDFDKASDLGRSSGLPGSLDDSSHCSLALLSPHRLSTSEQAAWDDLGEHAGTANVFSLPWLMRLSLRHFDSDKVAMLGVVKDADGLWIGAIPLERKRWHGRVPMPHWRGWSHANQFCSTPLVRKGRAVDFWRGLLAGFDSAPQGCLVLSLSCLALDEETNRALIDLCRAERREFALDRLVSRPALWADDAGLAGYMAQCNPRQRRRRESLVRRIENEIGPLRFGIARKPATIEATIEPFLAMEASGWKGQEGSALASAAPTRQFFADVAREGAARGAFELALLSAGTQPLAMSTFLLGRNWSYGFKMAIDERAARHGPGALLLDRLTHSLCERGQGRFDSCSPPGDDPVNRLWPARRELMDCRLAIGPALSRVACRLLASSEELFHAIKR